MAVTISPNLLSASIIILGVGWAYSFSPVIAEDSCLSHPLPSNILEKLVSAADVTLTHNGSDPCLSNVVQTSYTDETDSIVKVLLEILSNQKILQEKIENENQKSKDDFLTLKRDVRILQEQFLSFRARERSELHHNGTNERGVYTIYPDGARECSELYRNGTNESGVYTIYPDGIIGEAVRAYCDLSDGENGWTVIVSRRPLAVQVNFHRHWIDYRRGFGDPETEYWIGNHVLHKLTGSQPHVLRVDLEDWDGQHTYAQYETFLVEDEDHKYRLHVGGYSGDAGDALDYHNYQEFSTIDRDNDRWCDGSCSERYRAGFWHHGWPDVCFHAGPTNPRQSREPSRYGLIWNNDATITYRKMSWKIKPSTFSRE